jgi:hypothetical protein
MANMKAGDVGTLTITFSEAPQASRWPTWWPTACARCGDVWRHRQSAGVHGAVHAAGQPRHAGSVTLSAPPAIPTWPATAAGRRQRRHQHRCAGAGVLISSSVAALKAGETALITFTFSEAPSGFAVGDISATGGTLSGFTATANPLVYTAVFTPTPASVGGTASISVASNVYSDAAGNVGLGGARPASASTRWRRWPPPAARRFSIDSGSSSTDLITSVAGQIVSGTLTRAGGGRIGAGVVRRRRHLGNRHHQRHRRRHQVEPGAYPVRQRRAAGAGGGHRRQPQR